MILIVAGLNEMWKYHIRKSQHQSSKPGRADRAIIENDNIFRCEAGQISQLKYFQDFVMQRNVHLSDIGYQTALGL